MNSKAFSRDRFVKAIRKMRTMLAAGFPNLYDKYISWHANGGFNAVAHGGLTFIAWHRVFLWEFEKDLQAADVALGKDGKIALAYWDWINDTSTDPTDARGTMWKDDLLGPNGSGANNEVMSGPFVRASWPPWPAAGMPVAPPALAFLRRTLGAGALSDAADVKYIVGLSRVDVSPYTGAAANTSFRNVLEGFQNRTGSVSYNHNGVHGWVGGNMNNTLSSPYEPAFWFNHANVDRIWAIWQAVHPGLAKQWPTNAEIDAAYPPLGPRPSSVRKLDEPMLPWDGTAGTRLWTPRKVLNWQTMGPVGEHQYRYDTDSGGSFSFT